jgi:inner membrane protein
MDSITQIVLGAACGELVGGRKLGNRAMAWGALGGTLPDMDVLSGLFCDELTATAFHRGFMHSVLFSVMVPWLLGWLAVEFYRRDIPGKRGYRLFFGITWMILYLLAALGVNLLSVILTGSVHIQTLLITAGLGIGFGFWLWRDFRRVSTEQVVVSYLLWVQLFFWSVITHPLLDCFTNYGTQLWQPFFDTRIQWSTVSVVDPLYTLPFGSALLISRGLMRESGWRRAISWMGMLWGCGYLAYTVYHKRLVGEQFELALERRGVEWSRYQTNPTIFNNIVWMGLAETDTAFHISLYGFNDANPTFHPFSVIPKQHHLLEFIPETDRAKRFLRWFTDGYFNVQVYAGDTFQVNDLRFGLIGDSLRGDNFVFPFLLFRNSSGVWDIVQGNRRQFRLEEQKGAFEKLWDRVRGRH